MKAEIEFTIDELNDLAQSALGPCEVLGETLKVFFPGGTEERLEIILPDILQYVDTEGKIDEVSNPDLLLKRYFLAWEEEEEKVRHSAFSPTFIEELANQLFVVPEWHYERIFPGLLHGFHGVISAIHPDDPPGKGGHRVDAFYAHQKFSSLVHEERAKKVGVSAEVSVGFFSGVDAEEISLVEENVLYKEHLYIGRGCKDLQISEVRLSEGILKEITEGQFHSPDEIVQMGWGDGMGTHVEYFCPHKRILVRESMTGRHCYRLKVDDNGWVEVTKEEPCESCEAEGNSPPEN